MSNPRRSFLAVIADLRAGRTMDEATEQLGKLIMAVEQTGKGGEMLLRIKVKPAAKDSSLITITDEIATKEPKMDRAPTLMFANKDNGSLTLDDPNATPKGSLREVGAPATAPLREVKEQSAHVN